MIKSDLILVYLVLCLILLQVWLTDCELSAKKPSKCMDDFLKGVEVLNIHSEIVEAMKGRANPLKGLDLSLLKSRKRVVLDATFGLTHSVFHHMTQLNITGVDQSGNITHNCVVDKSQSALTAAPINDLIYLNVGQLQWSHLLESHPSALVIVNDMSDIEWHEYLNPITRTKPDASLTVDRRMFGKISLGDTILLRGAYRNLVTCAVPSKQLLSLDISNTSSKEYWNRLISFLGISVTPSHMKELIDGGVQTPLKENAVCTFGGVSGTVCGKPYWDVSPSVCEPPPSQDDVSRQQHLTQCAVKYSSALSRALGSSAFGDLVLSRLMEAPTAIRRAEKNTERLILDAGPGTTGTRTLHLVMSQLNITARHYKKNVMNCSFAGNHEVNEIDSDMRVLLRHDAGPVVYWGDTPVPERWWHLLKMYPRTRIIMTDVRNDSTWLIKRLTEHCSNASSRIDEVWSPCTIPLPVGFDRWTPLSLRFYRAVHLSAVNASVTAAAFDAYRELVRCSVPPSQLKWIYVAEQNNASSFWNELIDFFAVNITNQVKNQLIACGVPRLGSKGCSVGGKPCVFNQYGSLEPSVCTMLG